MNQRIKKVIFGSNLKMYKTNHETLAYLARLQELTKDISRDLLALFILPSYTAIADCCRMVDPALVRIGAQNVHWHSEGCFTGEISVRMLQELGADFVMIGHAERRQFFGETDLIVNKRVLTSLNMGFYVLICVGDSAQDKELGIFKERLSMQLKTALHGVKKDQLSRVWVAYEPVWAIGEGGSVATPDYANSIHNVLHNLMEDLYPEIGGQVPILYGGSVNMNNAADLIVQPRIDGLFIGRAAWDADNFSRLIRIALHAIQ